MIEATAVPSSDFPKNPKTIGQIECIATLFPIILQVKHSQMIRQLVTALHMQCNKYTILN